jgi:NAD dependent epimerase/dehydratase family enzyme
VAPEPVTNAEFTATLARVLRRPAVLPVPKAVLKLTFGALADETLLASIRAVPGRLEEVQYRFRHERLEQALRHVLGRAAGQPA